MSDEFNKSKHKGHKGLPQLQSDLRRSESVRGGLTALTARTSDTDKYTIGDHSGEVVRKLSLELALDPDGDLAAPEGTALVCRGTAFVSNSEKKVAAFRRAEDADAG